MATTGRAQTRVSVPLDRSLESIAAEVAGDGRARVRIRTDLGRAAGPPEGTRSYPASWRAGNTGGEASVTLFPFASWGYELEIAVSAPSKPAARLLWSRRRLDRLAAGLAGALRDAAQKTPTRTPTREAFGTVKVTARPRATAMLPR